MEKLPLEITENVLTRLPVVSKLQCREVCTTLQNLLPKPKMGLLYMVSHKMTSNKLEAEIYFSEQNDDDKFSSSNHVDERISSLGTLTKLDQRIIMPSTCYLRTFIVGSCKGLVCYASHIRKRTSERKVYICNPVTGEQIQLPVISKWVENPDTEQGIGFGYNPSSKEYKVVRIMSRMVYVYTLQGGVLSKHKFSIGNQALSLPSNVLPSVGVFARGALHWIESVESMIVTFDLENERFELLSGIPAELCDTNHVELMELGGNLCVLEVFPSKHVTIWESSFRETRRRFVSTWRTIFRLEWEDYSWFEPFGLNKGLLWYNVVLSCYDPVTKTLKKLDETLKKLMDDSMLSEYSTTRAIRHVNSLVSLTADMEETGGKKKQQKERGNKKRRAMA